MLLFFARKSNSQFYASDTLKSVSKMGLPSCFCAGVHEFRTWNVKKCILLKSLSHQAFASPILKKEQYWGEGEELKATPVQHNED